MAQAFRFEQFGQYRRCAVHAFKRIWRFAFTQIVLQRFNDVRHGVKPHHISGAEGARAGTTELFAGQVIDHVVAQAKVFSFLDGGQHAGNAHTVGDEVGRVVGANHTFTGFKVVEHFWLGGRGVDELDQRHVTRRVEKVNAAKTWLDCLWQCFAQCGDRQARRVAGHDGAFSNEGRYLVVQVGLPVHALGNGLDDQVAIPQLL